MEGVAVAHTNDNAHNLENVWKRLQQEWHVVQDGWQDAVAQRFAQEVWAEYEQTMPASLRVIQNLQETLARMRQEVP
jgi:uncharacterized protein YukE